MVKPEILNQSSITMTELKEELAKIKERDGELNFRANKTEEYLHQASLLQTKKAAELKEKLAKLDVARLKEEHITKIVDLLPETAEHLKVILQGYTLTLSKENAKKIVDLVAEYKK